MSPPAPEQGQLVDVRQRRYLVTEVVKSALPHSPGLRRANGAQHLVTLSSVEDDSLAEELQVIWELEPGAHIHERMALPAPSGGFDSPARLDAFLDAVRWGAASSADVRSIQSPFRSGIDIEDYQLDPVVRAVQMPRANLLIADDVGLGKTIEAGLVILELLIRRRARSVLVVCPSSLQIQWRDQMRDKFGLEFRIVDSDLMRSLRRTRGLHVNPWNHFPRLISSVDFIKRERPLRLFREVLPLPGEPQYPRRFDILVVDEADNVAPQGRGKFAIDSQRTQAIRLIAPHFEHRLFLTATPHNGYRESFTGLLEIIDSQRFAREIDPDPRQLRSMMVRRLKSELPPRWDGRPRFPPRKLEAIEVDYSPEEKRIHAALKEYTRLRRGSSTDRAERHATEFVLKLLKKRLFSSPAAFSRTLEQHTRSLRVSTKGPTAKPSLGVLRRQLDLLEEDSADDEEVEETIDDAVDAATRLFCEPTKTEDALLKEMRDWASAAAAQPDSKTRELIRWLEAYVKPGKWSNERVIIFTEYRDTQKWLHTILASEGFAGSDRLLTLYGGMDSEERERIKAAFQAHPSQSAVRILLATDAASEGIDLQNHCHRLIHNEIPWNPNRLEQRNGRIDRHGQRAEEVLIYHFVGKGYRERTQSPGQRAGDLVDDLEFLMQAAQKVQAIREDLGKVGPVIAEQVEEAMLGDRTALDTGRAEEEAKPVRNLLKFERDLKALIERLVEELKATRKELHLSPENVQTVVETALELARQPALIPANLKDVWPDPLKERTRSPVFRLPALKGTWALCSEGLAHPHTGEIRPIVFDHNLSKGRDDVVLAHLNNRLVQMSLRLLRAEVWSREGTKRLHRVTARIVPDRALDTPAVIGHARLIIIGGDCHLLHEEIITAGGSIREGRFRRMNVGDVERALEAGLPTEPSQSVKERLASLWPQHADSLALALDQRAKERASGLEKALVERADKEVADITTVLTELKRSIEEEVRKPAVVQLEFFNDIEKEQVQRNRESLEARLRELPAEVERETGAIRSRFEHPTPRLFPVAVTYLVPEKLARE